MWTPNIVEKERIFDKIKIIVEFTDGTTSFTDVYHIDSANMDNLKIQLENKIDRLHDKSYLETYITGRTFVTEKGSSVYILPAVNPDEEAED